MKKIILLTLILVAIPHLFSLLLSLINDTISTESSNSVGIQDSHSQKKTKILYSNSVSYNSYLDIPNDMVLSDNKVFTILHNLYSSINFFGEYEKGNLEEYDYYKAKFLKLLNSEYKFVIESTGEQIFINEYADLKSHYLETFNLNNYYYTYFDIDEDGSPELGIVVFGKGTYIFKYIPIEDEFILWLDLSPSYYQLNGSLKVRYNREDTSHVFYLLNKDGDMKDMVSFFIRDTFNKETNHQEIIYAVSLPKVSNEILPELENIKNQAYYVEDSDVYYFRVTEQQFIELTKNYFEAEESANMKIKEVTFTYDELFGSIQFNLDTEIETSISEINRPVISRDLRMDSQNTHDLNI